MKKVITTGKTVELATELALKKLGVSRDRVTVSVLTQPSRGLFGLFGTRDAELEVEVNPLSPIDETRKFVDDLLAAMNLCDVSVEVAEDGDHAYTMRLSGESIGILIGRRGATLDALQVLINLVANKHSEHFLRIGVDAEDYRLRRKETLEKLADRLAGKAVSQRREIQLEPMASIERKIIHSYLQGRTDVVTYSQGEDPYRKVVIAPKERGPKRQPTRPRGERRTGSKEKEKKH
jgi:spoIIIJ-associated protein